MSRLLLSVVAIAVLSAGADGTATPRDLLPGQRPLLHAHNCYPEGEIGADRLDRALGVAVRPIAIEQDLVWAVDRRASVVSHGAPLTGAEPTLEAHFFDRLRPLVEQALRRGERSTWPLFILHLDFKTNEPEHHRAIWDLLGRHEAWLTTAPRTADAVRAAPLTVGPVLVLTEQGAGQETLFHDAVPIGARLRIFGTVLPLPRPEEATPEGRAKAAAAAPVESLMPAPATNYRRWTNHSWAVIEAGGAPSAGRWTDADARRLRAVVTRAHALQLFIRFYTLNGHGRDSSSGWNDGYNFGSEAAAAERWRAAIAAGVDFIATDQYEALARLLRP